MDGETFSSTTAHVVIAAITSCTNTSNPSVMLGAGLLARKAVERGPDAQAVGQDVAGAGLEGRHRLPRPRRADRAARGSSASTSSATAARRASATPGPLPDEISAAVNEARPRGRARCSSGNRNFEGRINPDVKMNYLASPPLVVAYALAGHDGHRPRQRAARHGRRRRAGLPARHLADDAGGRRRPSRRPCSRTCSASSYGEVFDGDERWNGARRARRRPLRLGRRLDLRAQPAVLRGHAARARRRSTDIEGARVLAMLGDSVTTDHISPAGSIKKDSAGRARTSSEHGVEPRTSTPTARGAATTR